MYFVHLEPFFTQMNGRYAAHKNFLFSCCFYHISLRPTNAGVLRSSFCLNSSLQILKILSTDCSALLLKRMIIHNNNNSLFIQLFVTIKKDIVRDFTLDGWDVFAILFNVCSVYCGAISTSKYSATTLQRVTTTSGTQPTKTIILINLPLSPSLEVS